MFPNIDNSLRIISKLALSYQPDSFDHFRLECRYYKGVIEGPDCQWKDVDGREVGWDNALIRRISEQYRESIDIEMRNLYRHDRANNFEMTVFKSGLVEHNSYFDPTQEDRKEAEVRQVLGDEEYERLDELSNDNHQATLARSFDNNDETSECETLSSGELFSFLYHSVTQDLDIGWNSVSIEFDVAKEGDTKQLSANYIVKDKDGNLSTFEPKEVFGPLNAMNKLREMSAEEGDVWFEAVFSLFPNGGVSVDAKIHE